MTVGAVCPIRRPEAGMKWTLIGVPSNEAMRTSRGAARPAGSSGYPRIGCSRSLTIGIWLTTVTIGVISSGPMIGTHCNRRAVNRGVSGVVSAVVVDGPAPDAAAAGANVSLDAAASTTQPMASAGTVGPCPARSPASGPPASETARRAVAEAAGPPESGTLAAGSVAAGPSAAGAAAAGVTDGGWPTPPELSAGADGDGDGNSDGDGSAAAAAAVVVVFRLGSVVVVGRSTAVGSTAPRRERTGAAERLIRCATAGKLARRATGSAASPAARGERAGDPGPPPDLSALGVRESWPPLSAAATAGACGAIRESPSANAASPMPALGLTWCDREFGIPSPTPIRRTQTGANLLGAGAISSRRPQGRTDGTGSPNSRLSTVRAA